MKIYGRIYLITNLVNAKQYVGQTVRTIRERWLEHCNNAKNSKKINTIITKAIKKYGRENFKVEEIDVAYNQNELNLLEGVYISWFKTLIPNGYNMTDIINGKGKPSEKTRERMRIACTKIKKLNQLSEIHKKKQGKSILGSKSKYAGVYLIKNKYVSNLCFNSKTIYLGIFNTEEDAAKAYDIKALELFGDDCTLNFPDLRKDYINDEIFVNKRKKLYSSPKNITYQKDSKNWVVRIKGYKAKSFKDLNDAIFYKESLLCQ